jgi:4-hydroxyphenylacetate 3-monooxygenase
MNDTTATTTARKLRSAADYRESLRDGRRVYYRGEQVLDVTTHPVFKHAVNHTCLDFEMAEDERYSDLAVAPDRSRNPCGKDARRPD